ncbi:TorF family putative porin [Allosphingosinicella deserti]|uniref:Porin domain-containing protein n=1 Tax=Allosphingosinicella deserti TaxID=2116704 RepID=A0A2P7QKE7_9SPHN|nr:TorF family putative porin [Sphingomonas deserti]PSJ38447.1 hypothetical protein C7I55_18590 [Sphingomonas deserti]
MMRFVHLLSVACAAAALILPASASAAGIGSGLSISGDAALVSDYRFRGVSLSGEDPALQGGLTISHESGLYAGAWGSSIEDSDLMGEVELDLVGGWSGDLAAGMSADVSITYYHYPNGKAAAGNSDYAEAIAKLTRSFANVEAGVGAAYSWEQEAIGGDNLYLFGDASTTIPGTPLTVNAHIGRSSGSLDFGDPYLDWAAGVETTFGPVRAGAAYVDSDLAGELGGSALVLSIGLGF